MHTTLNVFRYEKRITFLRKSLFNKFYIKGFKRRIDEYNSKEISRTLFKAMTKSHAPDKLEVEFDGKLNRTMNQIAVDYKDNITCLHIRGYRNEELLMQSSFMFENLDSLCLDGSYTCDDSYEPLLARHANNLKHLTVKFLRKNLKVPALPKLDSLCVRHVNEEYMLPFLEQSRTTISKLDVLYSILPSNMDESNNSDVYKMPNIKQLNLFLSFNFKFVLFNAENLVSLVLFGFKGDDGIDNVVWPEFPNLRELCINDPRYLPILLNCRDTLERLDVINFNSSDENGEEEFDYEEECANLKMQRLTDLHVVKCSQDLTSKIISSNHKSLEFMYLSDIFNFDEVTRMERIKMIILECVLDEPSYTADHKKALSDDYPNAEVILSSLENREEIRKLVKSRCKRRNFSMYLYPFYNW
jgi:hypothetical protein